MRRLGDVRLPPLAWVAIAAAVTAVLRFVVALQIDTPFYYSDEYLNAAVSRAIGDGTFGQIRGGSGQPYAGFTSYVPPLLQAPLWQIGDVAIAYRLTQALNAVAFASSAFPAYALARRLDVTSRGSVAVALLALVVPAGVLSTNVLGEPYAYPLFLGAVFLGVDALARGTALRQLFALGAAVALCFVGGLQLAFVAAAYVVVWCVVDWRSPRQVARRLAVTAGIGVFVLVAFVVGGRGGSVDYVTTAIANERWSPDALGPWLAANAFILAIAAGWVLVPGAAVALWALGRSPSRAHRAFAYLSVLMLVAMLVESGLWGTRDQGVYERFTFYGAPLVAVAFVWAAENLLPRRLAYSAVGYLAALAAVLLPVTDPLFAAEDTHAPTLLGLTTLAFGRDVGGGIWAPILVLLALATAWRGISYTRALVPVALTVAAVTSVGASFGFVERVEPIEHVPQSNMPEGAAILVWEGSHKAILDETLFWNPQITRVALLGPGQAPDLLPFVRVQLAPGPQLLDEAGQPLAAPYVVGADVLAVGGRATGNEHQPLVALSRPPSLLALGWYRDIGYLSLGGLFYAVGDDRPLRVGIELRSSRDTTTVAFRCDRGFGFAEEVGTRPREVTVPVDANSVRSCRFSSLGRFERVGVRALTVAAKLSLRRR